MVADSQDNKTKIPALDCRLEGGYLIEASAGTGKTWTLTGIILRLLVEKKYSPEKIIATTFTRAAAAEMQERIQARIQSFYGLIYHIKNQQVLHPDWFDESLPLSQRLDLMLDDARQAGLEADDQINQHILGHLLGQGLAEFDLAVRRTALLLNTLDKLFVGTLDSLAQKWLREFSAQIGYQSDVEIVAKAKDQVTALVHDELRAIEADIQTHQPALFALFEQLHPDFFGQVDQMVLDINNALQFFTAQIDQLPPMPMDADTLLEGLSNLQKDLMALDRASFARYFGPLAKSHKLSMGSGKLGRYLSVLDAEQTFDEILWAMGCYGPLFFGYLSKQIQDFIKKAAQFEQNQDESVFVKDYDQQTKEDFFALNWSVFARLFAISQQGSNLVAWHICQIRRRVALAVRDKLGDLLDSSKLTTFTLQMLRLNTALANKDLSHHIRHHYPVALIDESQDVNGLQVDMICKVYLNDMKASLQFRDIKPPKGFVLLVGDPKQAIYRFRGGDVTNYNYLKHFGHQGKTVLDSSLVLDVNRRSNKYLIQALNTWFDASHGEIQEPTNHAYLGKGVFYLPITAHEERQQLSWQTATNMPSYLRPNPVAVLHLDYPSKNFRHLIVAQHINSILQGGYSLKGRAVNPGDFAVLATKKEQLQQMQVALSLFNIPAISASEVNVFQTKAGQDLYTLIDAWVHPNDSECLGAVLTSDLFGVPLSQVAKWLGLDDDGDQSSDKKSQLLTYLKKCYDKWQTQGLSSALNFAFLNAPFDQKNLWLQAAKQGERYVADLNHLVELVSGQSFLQELRLLDWYQEMMVADADEDRTQRALPSEIGVRLMTIHKSKGLEFPIVYVLGLDDGLRKKEPGLFAYSDNQDGQYIRRLSATAQQQEDLDYFKRLNHQEEVDERRRLGYVALTRASEQVFLVACDSHDKSGIKDRPLYQWLENTQSADLRLPDRLVGQVAWIDVVNDEQMIDAAYLPDRQESKPIDYVPWSALIKQQKFLPLRKTSFTALVARLYRGGHQPIIDQADYDQMSLIDPMPKLSEQASQEPGQDIRSSFMRGLGAGVFLHKVLQFIKSDSDISAVVDDQLQKLGLPQKYSSQQSTDGEHDLLVAWLHQIRHSPLCSSGLSLAELDDDRQVRELAFTLGLSDGFGVQHINQIFADFSDKSLLLLEDQDQYKYRHLRGEIDLVYEHDQKFYIVDYKSNYLGDEPQDYGQEQLAAAMDKAGYWLQAAIYQLALHRLLKMKVANYTGNEHRYLGTVEYFFLRGATQASPRLGKISWQVPLDLILKMDELF